MAREKALTLYEHVEALAVVDTWFDEAMPDIEKADGEVPEALAALLDMTSEDFNDKAERVALKINSYIAESAAIQAEADRLARRAKARKARAEYLKRYLLLCLTKANVPKVNGLLVNVRIQKNGMPSVKYPPMTQFLLEALYARSFIDPGVAAVVEKVVEFRLSPRLVLNAATAGLALPEGITIEHGTHLRID